MHVYMYVYVYVHVHVHCMHHITENFRGIKFFANAVKVAISAMQFLTQEEKIFSWRKFPAVWYLIIIVCTFAAIPYSRKIWQGTKFGGLVDCLSNRQIKIRQNFLLAYMYMYGDPVPNHQNFSQTLV